MNEIAALRGIARQRGAAAGDAVSASADDPARQLAGLPAEAPGDCDRAAELRDAMTGRLVAEGWITSPAVERAFRTVPRHLFVPGVPLEQAYANDTVRTKRDENGVTISSVSAPWLQAVMLEQAGLGPGLRCLEVGSGGYNAASWRSWPASPARSRRSTSSLSSPAC